jgi:2-iminoacetate synthase ThiH
MMASAHPTLVADVRERASIREILDSALAGARLTDADAVALIECPDADLDAMLSAAAELRDRGHHRREVTYSRKVFLPVTNLCRDRCTYCTFRKDPGDPGAWTKLHSKNIAKRW